ncbi:beta-glucosidase, partial [Mycolicibacterium smegmatis]
GERVWRDYGFIDAFCEARGWFADTYLAIDQGPIVVMMENHRTGLLWKLFMSAPEVQAGLRRLDFSSPHL